VFGAGCYACGADNPKGLHLRMVRVDDDWIVGRFDPSEHHHGAPDVLHGGIAAALIDEIMVWAGLAFERVMSVTGTMQLRYRRPVGVRAPIEVRGRIIERRGRRMSLAAEIVDEDVVAVEGSGLYLVTSTLDDLQLPR
jgi:acyl-coenzyme A thioesterase PaaI-like protein